MTAVKGRVPGTMAATAEPDVFDQVRQALLAGDVEAGFDLAICRFLEERSYPLVFEARLMRARQALGMPLIQTGPWTGLSPDVQAAYERATVDAAREVGSLFLADGEIGKAWPYFRALGEKRDVRKAIEEFDDSPGGEAVDGVIEVAYHEQVSPEQGFRLILKHYGTCRAITNFSQYPAEEGRADCAHLLAENVYSELLTNIKYAVRKREEVEPRSDDLAGIVTERAWLFEGNAYYLDTSHVSSVVQLAPSIERRDTLELLHGMTEYGRRLGEMYQFPGNPPFENVFEDHGVYIGTVLGRDVEHGLAHFRRKIDTCDPRVAGTAPAQALVNLLVRIGRAGEAADVASEHLSETDPQFLTCPNALQLCQLAGDYRRLAELARQRRDLLSFAAATMQAGHSEGRTSLGEGGTLG